MLLCQMPKDNSKPQYDGDQRYKVRKLIEEAKSGNERSTKILRILLYDFVTDERTPDAAIIAAMEGITNARDGEVDQIIESN